MATKIQVNFAELKNTETKIEQLAEEYRTEYKNLDTAINELSVGYNGKASAAYVDQIAGLKDNFERMRTVMLEYVDFFKKAGEAYQRHEEELAALARRQAH